MNLPSHNFSKYNSPSDLEIMIFSFPYQVHSILQLMDTFWCFFSTALPSTLPHSNLHLNHSRKFLADSHCPLGGLFFFSKPSSALHHEKSLCMCVCITIYMQLMWSPLVDFWQVSSSRRTKALGSRTLSCI